MRLGWFWHGVAPSPRSRWGERHSAADIDAATSVNAIAGDLIIDLDAPGKVRLPNLTRVTGDVRVTLRFDPRRRMRSTAVRCDATAASGAPIYFLTDTVIAPRTHSLGGDLKIVVGSRTECS